MQFSFNHIKRIKTKILLQNAVLIILSIFLMFVMVYSIEKISSYNEAETKTQELANNILQMRKYEKDFMLNDIIDETFYDSQHSISIDKIHQIHHQTSEQIVSLQTNNAIAKMDYGDTIQMVENLLSEYVGVIDKLKNVYLVKGFKSYGHEGSLREAIHKIEKGDAPYNEVLMLSLRRCEKDFMIRKDMEYVIKFDKLTDEFLSSIDGKYKALLIPAILKYKKEFHQVVYAEQSIGLTNNEGVKAELQTIVSKIEPLLEDIQLNTKRHVKEAVMNTYILLISLFGAQLTIAIVVALSFSKSMTKSVQTINESVTTLSNGEFPATIHSDLQDEIGNTSRSINLLVERIKTAAVFSEEIGNGNLDITYDEHFNNDVLAVTLQNMHAKLKAIEAENAVRNWSIEGLAKFGEILRTPTNSISELGDIIISFIVTYTNSNQGALFIVNDIDTNNTYLELLSCYAWNKKKYIDKRIELGEGLVGQAWQEMDTIHLTEIPNDFINISSGLGGANPNSIIISPVVLNDEVFGVLEIASFKPYPQSTINFIQTISESIAATLSTTKTNDRTKRLLEQSQQMTEEMRAQEEEIRQNMEEMNATQEEMERKEREMRHRVKALEKELEELKQQQYIS